ncbi:KOW motif-containing protein, partial [Patescibacteria group bacterium]|nr:KOW motif-containing protein [Patescibacteria group bacterium]
MKLKKGDIVLITAGKEKGKKVKITKTLPQVGRVVLDGANI